MRPTKHLPDRYRPIGTVDLTQDRAAFLLLNVIGVVLFFVFGYGFLYAASALRGGANLVVDLSPPLLLLTLLALVVQITLHELVHGLFFWLFTRERPHFGFRWAYAYAAAPEWYLPRNQFIVVGAAPLVVLTLAGLALVPFLPAWALLPLLLALTLNAAGAVGDIWSILWLLPKPSDTLVRDLGESFTAYGTL